ncbi:MAG: hypothetical protein FJ288_13465 [Planctomycetes bacterium]|nr:hypothetical protein [Planctomycetota bacterium]
MKRREWLKAAAAAAAALLLATAPRAEDAAPAPAAKETAPAQRIKWRPDVAPGDNPAVDLELDPRSRLALAAVSLNGAAGRFLLATGAVHTVVTPDFAAKVGIDRTAVSVPVTGGAPGAQAKIARVQSLKVGATDFTNFDVRIMALDDLARHLERPADGVLAANVLLAAPVTLDYSGKRLVFGRPADLSGRKELPAEVSSNRLVVQATLDGEKAEFVVDTGANFSIVARSAWQGKTEPGPAQGAEFAVPQNLTLGGLAFENMKFVVGARNLLGVDFFRRGEVVLDVTNKKLYVLPQALTEAGRPTPPAGPAPATAAGGPPDKPPGQAEPPPVQPPAAPAKPLPPALEKQVADFQVRLVALQEEEFKTVMGVIETQRKAVDALGIPAETAAEDLALQRRSTKPLRDYKALLTGLVQQLQALDGKFASLMRQIRTAEADRRTAEARPRLDALIDKTLTQRKNIQDRIADLWEKAGDYPAAIAIYEAECQALTERNRIAETRAVKEKLAEACYKARDYPKALVTYKGIYDAIPQNERGRNVNLMFRLALMYERTGDLRNALDIYREAQKNIPPGATVTGLAEKITSLESRVGTPAESSSNPSSRAR